MLAPVKTSNKNVDSPCSVLLSRVFSTHALSSLPSQQQGSSAGSRPRAKASARRDPGGQGPIQAPVPGVVKRPKSDLTVRAASRSSRGQGGADQPATAAAAADPGRGATLTPLPVLSVAGARLELWPAVAPGGATAAAARPRGLLRCYRRSPCSFKPARLCSNCWRNRSTMDTAPSPPKRCRRRRRRRSTSATE